MAEWTAVIGSTTIMENASFQLGIKAEPNNRNVVESLLNSLVIEGDVVAATPAAVADAFVTLSALASGQGGPVGVQLKLDGTVKFNWQPEDGFVGPFVVSFASVDDPGNGHGHWRYRIEILFRSKTDEDSENAYELTATVSVTKDHDRVIRKVWTVAASARSLTAARNFVKAFKPAGNDFQQEDKDDFINARAMSVWVWEAVQQVQCSVVIEGGGREYEYDELAGEDTPPVLYLKTQSPKFIRVRGTVRGYNTDLKRPAKHFAESATLKDITAARRFDVQIEDEKKGIYVLPFEEDWICTDAADPAPNHEKGHNLIALDVVSKVPDNGHINTL